VPLKEHVPLALRMRARRALDYRPRSPRQLASASAEPAGPLHRRFRRAYRRRHFDRFFRPLLDDGALVFDVGANVGEWTDSFRRLGCRVVAVEPQPDCAAAIETRYADDPLVEVVAAAVGDRPGVQPLFQARIHSEHASMAPDFMEALVAAGMMPADAWGEPLEVRVVTLDELAARHGDAEYVKLDVEGFEPAALAGLSNAPRLLSFEFHRATWEGAARSLELVERLGHYECNVTMGEWLDFGAPRWRPPATVAAELEALPRTAWGNVFARLAES
jgi:FkbM family methyltransferase